MGIFRQFPYSNFHDMNMDTVLRIMREMQDEWSETKAEWASYKDFIDNYFNNLNLNAETERALRRLIADGTLDTVIDPVIVAEVEEWLTKHITPTTPPVDDTLTIQGAAADAKKVGDNFNNTIMSRSIIPDNSDIDTYKTNGVYVVSTSSSAGTMNNWPAISTSGNPLGGILIVASYGVESATYGKSQIVISNDAMWTRYYTSNAWSPWHKAINELDTPVIRKGTIPNNSDIDTYKEVGMYAVSTSSGASSLNNWPCLSISGAPLGGSLLVFRHTATAGSLGIAQIAICTDRAYTRYYTSNAWSPWRVPLYNYDIADAITASEEKPPKSSAVFDSIYNNNRVYMGVSGHVASDLKREIPVRLLEQETIIKDHVMVENWRAGLTQGICCDNKHVYFALGRGPGYPSVIRKWSLANNELIATSEPLDIGHVEDICFVPAWAPGFDNGSVDRLYCVDLNYSTSHPTGYYIHVVNADTMELITSFATNNLINNSNWNGVGEISFNNDRGMFAVESYPVEISGTRSVIIATFDYNGTLVKAITIPIITGTCIGTDSDKYHIYIGRYFSSESDTFIIYAYAFTWELMPVCRYSIDSIRWEVEGMTHCEDSILFTWNNEYDPNRDVEIIKMHAINEYYDADNLPPYNWPSSDSLERENITVIYP